MTVITGPDGEPMQLAEYDIYVDGRRIGQGEMTERFGPEREDRAVLIKLTDTREQVRPVIYDEMKREESERRIRLAMFDAIDHEVARIAEVAQVPETFLSYRRSCEDYSYPQRFVAGIDPAIDPDRIVTGSISADYITLDGFTLTDEREETLRSYYEGDLRAVRSDSFTFTTTDYDPDLLTLLYGEPVPYEEDDIDHCS